MKLVEFFGTLLRSLFGPLGRFVEEHPIDQAEAVMEEVSAVDEFREAA